jgi:hypothetical protein
LLLSRKRCTAAADIILINVMQIKIESISPKSPIHMIWGIFALGLLITGRLIEGFVGKLPPCVFKKVTGIPCLTCGATRSVVALSNFDIIKSFKFNPLMLLAVLVTLGFSFFVFLGWLSKRRVAVIMSSREKVILRYSIIILIISNWAYLIFISEV